MATIKTKLAGVSGPSKSGVYHFKKRTPAVLLNYIEKKELWIELGKTLSKYEEVVSKIDMAVELAKNDFIPMEQKRNLILTLLGEADTNILKSVRVEEDEEMLLSNVIEKSIKYKKARMGDEKLSDETILSYQKFYDLLLDITGDTYIKDFTKQDNVDLVKQVIERLPNGNKMKYYNRERIIKKIKQDLSNDIFSVDKKVELLSPSTVKMYFMYFNNLMSFYSKKGQYCDELNLKKIEIERAKKKGGVKKDEKVLPLTYSELKSIFNSHHIQAKVAKCAFFTGLRPHELRIAKVKVIEGIKCLSLLEEDIKDGKELKNIYSERVIPLHKSIEKDIVEVKEYYNSLEKPEKASITWKKTMVSKRLLTGEVAKKRQYSLRKSFANALDSLNIDLKSRQHLMGHSTGEIVLDIYTSTKSLNQLNQVIQSISIDLLKEEI